MRPAHNGLGEEQHQVVVEAVGLAGHGGLGAIRDAAAVGHEAAAHVEPLRAAIVRVERRSRCRSRRLPAARARASQAAIIALPRPRPRRGSATTMSRDLRSVLGRERRIVRAPDQRARSRRPSPASRDQRVTNTSPLARACAGGQIERRPAASPVAGHGGGPRRRSAAVQSADRRHGCADRSAMRYCAASASAWRRSTLTSCETPRSGMVTP